MPEGLVLGVPDGEAEHLPVAVCTHPGGDDDGLGDDVVVVSHMQVGGIEVDVREAVVVETAILEGAHVLVEACADARDLRAGDARGDAEGGDVLGSL